MSNHDMFGLSPTAVNSPPSVSNPGSSQSQMDHQQMQMPYPSDEGFHHLSPNQNQNQNQIYQPISGGAAVIPHAPNMNSGDQKRKRGRPRRYRPEGGMVSSPPHTFSVPPQAEISPGGLGSPTVKKARGRPRGSQNKKQNSANSGFIPRVVNVDTGEDISSKILSISQLGPRVVCVLSANGMVSHVTLSQAASSGGTASYEGRFEILSLSGSYMLNEDHGRKSRTGGLSVALAGPDGWVFGGSVAGSLLAASPSQVVVGCFDPDTHKESAGRNTESELRQKADHSGDVGPSPSPSNGARSGSSGGPASPLNLSSGACVDYPEGLSWK